jgi:predicted O-methyltransferase YrrM
MGHEYQSPLRRWDVLTGLCESIGAETFVEVGCKNGRTTGALLHALPELRVMAIDPWAPVPNADEDYSGWDFAAIEREFWENVGEHKSRVEMWRQTSAAAAFALTADSRMGESFDVVFIDAGHDYENALADIRAWWPLVREGGYLCGHDYQHKFPGVMRAVAQCFPLMRVAVMPDSVWCVQKDAALQLQEAA